MSIQNKDLDRLMRLADEIDDRQFMDFASRFMRANGREKISSSCGHDGKVVEEIRVTRRTTQEDEES